MQNLSFLNTHTYLFFIFCILCLKNIDVQSQKGKTPPPSNVIKKGKIPTLKVAPISYKIIDLGLKSITIRKPVFTIIGRNLGAEKPKWVKIQIFGIRSSGASGLTPDTKIVECKIMGWTSNLITVQTPLNITGGFYRVQVTIGQTVFNINSRLSVPGISHYELENITSKNISRSNTNTTTTLLLIRGTGFGKTHPVNFIKIGSERIANFRIWTDTLIVTPLPLSIKPGFDYEMTVRNNLGAQFTSLDNKELKFKYPGISSVTSLVDTKGKIKGKVFGSGFASFNPLEPKSIIGELYFNEIRINQIASWKQSEVEYSANFLRAGRYLPRIVIQRKEGLSNKLKRINLYSGDSIYITSRINFVNKKIFGSYYALSLRESKSLDQKINNYSSIIYTLPQDAKISIAFYDVMGIKKIGVMVTPETVHKKGRYELVFTRSDLVSGRYLLMLEIDKNIKIAYPFINQ